jgi:hypothetical protein
MTGNVKPDPREVARQAFRQAVGDVEPDVSRIVDAVPAMMVEARRRRAADLRLTSFSAVIPLARRAIPALAAAAAVLVLTATFVGLREPSGTGNGTAGLDGLILTGEVGGEVSDVLLEAMAERGGDNG